MEIKLDSVTYYNELNKKVIDDVTYDFYAGTVYGIIGPSGSGKSYLGKIISGLLKLEYGNIIYDNLTINDINQKKYVNYIKRQVGFLHENSEEQFIASTVYEELYSVLKKYNYKISQIDNRIQDVLKIVGLSENYVSRDPFTLSTGEMRKLALAKVLIYNPKVIVLDEPWIGLDAYEQKQLIKLIRRLKKRVNKTIIIITNNLEFLIQIADNVIVLERGSILKSGNKIDVFKDTRFLKKNNIQAPNTVLFSDIVLQKKKIKIGYRDQINDLIKDIYRYAEWGCGKND